MCSSEVYCFILLRLSTSAVRYVTVAALKFFISLYERKKIVHFVCEHFSNVFISFLLSAQLVVNVCIDSLLSLNSFVCMHTLVAHSDGVHFTLSTDRIFDTNTLRSYVYLCFFLFHHCTNRCRHACETYECVVIFCLSFFLPIPFAYTSHLCRECVYITITFGGDGVRAVFMFSHSFNFTSLYLSLLPAVLVGFTFRFSNG